MVKNVKNTNIDFNKHIFEIYIDLAKKIELEKKY